MDDGFQHRWVKAGLNILINNYNEPVYNDKIMPFGRLRDNLNSIKRSDIIITSKCPKNLSPTEKKGIKSHLNLFPTQKKFFSSLSYTDFKSIFIDRHINSCDQLEIILVTSISNAKPLINFLNRKHKIIQHLKFKDHHNYTKSDIKEILDIFHSFKSTKNIILTTEKDKVKFQDFKNDFIGINIYFVSINIVIDHQEEFNSEIIKYVTKNKRNM